MFSLTRMAMLRAVEIHLGSPALIEHPSSEKETTIALDEISQGRVTLKELAPKNKATQSVENDPEERKVSLVNVPIEETLAK